MRIDRTITILAGLLSRRNSLPKTVILMYHSVSDHEDRHHSPYFKTITPPSLFASQMQWLKEERVQVISLSDWNKPTDSPLRVAITFDDGFVDFYTYAAPIMKRFGYTATAFLPTRFIETGAQLEQGLEHLTWNQIKSLMSQGFEFGSHTVNHRFIGELTPGQIHEEISGSRLTITQETGTVPRTFACPYAFPEMYPRAVDSLLTALKENDYSTAVTTRIGTVNQTDNSLTLKRIPINGADDRKFFIAKLYGHYDWLYTVQHFVKLLKRVIAHQRSQSR